MTRDDIYTVALTEDMVAEARAEQAWLDKNKQGAKTRDLVPDKNVIGSLAHQAVELAFELSGFDFESTRKIRYKRGDNYDILYITDKLDVKGTRGKVHEKWYYNRGFLVFEAQALDPKFEEITHLVFVEVDLQGMEAHIYGVIPRLEFLDKCKRVESLPSVGRLEYPALEIRARELTPIRRFIYKT